MASKSQFWVRLHSYLMHSHMHDLVPAYTELFPKLMVLNLAMAHPVILLTS